MSPDLHRWRNYCEVCNRTWERRNKRAGLRSARRHMELVHGTLGPAVRPLVRLMATAAHQPMHADAEEEWECTCTTIPDEEDIAVAEAILKAFDDNGLTIKAFPIRDGGSDEAQG